MKKSLYIVALLMLFALQTAWAQQYKYEVGPALGMTGYLGENNNGNLFKHPSVTGGAIFRYIHNSRWAFKDQPMPEQFAFLCISRMIRDKGVYEYLEACQAIKKKYLPCLILLPLKKISPYMVAGVGFVFAMNNGHNQASFTIPIGIGVKYKFKDRWNLGFEFTMRKEFSDRIDGYSDLFGIKHSFAKNTDWYSFAMFTASYEFGKRCIKCNYIE